MDHHSILRTLSNDSFTEVCHLHTEVQAAVRILERGEKNDSDSGTEMNTIKVLDHPKITRTKEHICIAMDHAAGGDLGSRMRRWAVCRRSRLTTSSHRWCVQ